MLHIGEIKWLQASCLHYLVVEVKVLILQLIKRKTMTENTCHVPEILRFSYIFVQQRAVFTWCTYVYIPAGKQHIPSQGTFESMIFFPVGYVIVSWRVCFIEVSLATGQFELV